MATIGSLTVDLTLKSASFIRDLGKTSREVARNTTLMQRSLSSLTTGFGTLFSARLVRQISSVTTESLKLAASMHGPLADAAQKSLTQFEELQHTFQLGLAKGFLDETKDGLIDTAKNTKKAADAGETFGGILGFIARDAGQFFGTDLPNFIDDAKKKWGELNDTVNEFQGKLTTLSFDNMRSELGLTPEDTEIALSYGTATELAAMAQQSFWSATVETTAAGEMLLNQNRAYINFIESAGTPLEQYRLAIARIGEEQLGAAETARLTMLAQMELGNQVATVVGNVTQALSTAFKDNKAFAIADTVINTAQAVMKTYAQFGGGPWGIAAAASVAAIGAAQIATILSANPGKSSGGGKSKSAKSNGGGGGSSSSPARAGAASTASSTATTSQQAVNITLQGESGFSREQVRMLIEQLNQAVGDGAVLKVQPR